MLRAIDTAIVADLQALSQMFAEKHSSLMKNARKVVLGRDLVGSVDVIGGADFDLIIDGCLFEFKTSIRPKITTEMLRQLVGYWLLDYHDTHKIGAVAVVLMRHGHLQHFAIHDLLQTDIAPDMVRAGFRDGLRRDKAHWIAQTRLGWAEARGAVPTCLY